jgi:hypothetical protein
MGAYELTLGQQPLTRDPRTGRFRKGHIPANKGKRWIDYMPKRSQRRAAKGWANVDKFRKAGANAGWNKRPVVCITEDGVFVGRFESAAEAARIAGTFSTLISKCCSRNLVVSRFFDKKRDKYYHHSYIRQTAGKTKDGRRLRWFYEDDDRWIEIINKTK